MAAIDVINRVYREFKRYTGDGLPNEPTAAPLPVGDPSSGVHSPKKSDIRAAWLEPLAEALDAADRAEAAAALSGPTGVYEGTFTGDGVETTFVMSAEPSSAAHVWVALDGILQAPGTYSIDGTDLIFTTAPPETAADNISYRIVSIANGEDVPPDGSVTTAKLGALAVTEAKIADNAVTRAKIGDDAIGPDELDEDAVNANHIDAAAAAAIRVKLAIAFRAHMNGTPQTGIVSGTATKLLFGTESFDLGGYYSTATSRFTPPAGKYRLTAAVLTSGGAVDQSAFGALIYKNGALHSVAYSCWSGTANSSAVCTDIVDANGTDYFEVFFEGFGAGDKSVNGAATSTYFTGEAI